MNADEFWVIVERVHAAAPADMKRKCQLLADELRQLPVDEVASFERHFVEFFCQANTYDLWGAAYLICGGCGDDGFMDFRATLISLGRIPFEAAMACADSLADFDIDPKWVGHEGYQYVPEQVLAERPDYRPARESAPSKYPSGTRGEDFDPEEMTPRFPRLVAKYNHKDADPQERQEALRRRAEYEARTELVRKVLLQGIIPRNGLIPPPRIVRQVMASGKSPAASGLNYEWEPFALEESNFWVALTRLEHATATELAPRPDLQGKRLAIDTGCGESNDYEQWVGTLKARGLW
jgi:hypothetical protein